MSEFIRENRYIVIKRSDLDKLYKDPTKYATTFGHAFSLIAPHLPKRKFLVIESDWPEYEPAWQMIERRVSGLPDELTATQSELAALREELAKFDDAMRALACNLGAGGYNAEFLTADQLASKVQWGIDNLLKVEQQRLTAAEQRNAAMREALETLNNYGFDPNSGSGSWGEIRLTLEDWNLIQAASKPTESGASE